MKKKKKPRTLIDIMADNPDNKKFHLSGPMRQKALNDFSEYLKQQTASVTGASCPTQFAGLSQAATTGTGLTSGAHSHTLSSPYYTATRGIFTGGAALKTIFDEDKGLGILGKLLPDDTKIEILPLPHLAATQIQFTLTINSSEIDATGKRQSAKNIVARLKQAMEALSDKCLRELWWK